MTDRQLLRGQINLLYDLYQQALYPVVRHIENGHDVTYLFDGMYTIPRYLATAEEIAQADAQPDDGEVTVEDRNDEKTDIDDDLREFATKLKREWRRAKGRECPVTLYLSRQGLLTCFKLSPFSSFRDRERVRLDLEDEREEMLAALNATNENSPILHFENGQVRRTDLKTLPEVDLTDSEFDLLKLIYHMGFVTKQKLEDGFESFRDQRNASKKKGSINVEKNCHTHLSEVRRKARDNALRFTIKCHHGVYSVVSCE